MQQIVQISNQYHSIALKVSTTLVALLVEEINSPGGRTTALGLVASKYRVAELTAHSSHERNIARENLKNALQAKLSLTPELSEQVINALCAHWNVPPF